MKKVYSSIIFFLITAHVIAQVSASGCNISGALINQGSTLGCGNASNYCDIASLYVPAFSPTACSTFTTSGAAATNYSFVAGYVLPGGCTATITAEFKKRGYLGIAVGASGCNNAGMDGSPDALFITNSGGVIASQGSTIDVNVGTCGTYTALGTYTSPTASISAGCSNADGAVKMVLTGGSFTVGGASNRADEFITFSVTLSGTCGPGCTGVLPIELTDFYAITAPESIALYWHVAIETDTKEYMIEKSLDAVNWKKIGTVETNKSYSRDLFYRLVDTEPVKGLNYYRLSDIDYEEGANEHEIISVNYINRCNNFLVSQNDEELFITCNSFFGGSNLNLFDISGRLIRKVKISENNIASVSKKEVGKGLLLLSSEAYPSAGLSKIVVY